MALFKVALALCATVCVINAQFNPGPQPPCSDSTFMAHETYCNMYYRCLSKDSGLVAMKCGLGTQWDAKYTVCNTVSLPNTGVCSNWVCNGNRYPDVCCNKYWTCASNNAWVVSECPAGTTFDMGTGQCLATGTVACVENSFCLRNVVNNPNFACTLQENPTGNQCTYIQAGYVRECPVGSSFNLQDCGCTNRNLNQCSFKFDFAANKAKDVNCRASFRTQFDNALSLMAYSDKLSMSISDVTSTPNLRWGGGYYLGARGAVSVNGNEAMLLSNGYIYSNYFANNEIHMPTAIVVEFRPTAFMTGNSIDLLSNTFSYLNDVLCANSLTVTVRNDGLTNNGGGFQNSYRYTFNIALTGVNSKEVQVAQSISDLSIVVPQSTLTNLGESGSPLNYLRFTLALSGSTATAQVVELDSNININQNRQSRTIAFSVEHLNNSQCGLTVGSSMTGSVRGFSVYEGCDNGFINLINNP